MDNLHNKRVVLPQLVSNLSNRTETASRKLVDRLESERDKERKPLGDLAGNLQKLAELRNKQITQKNAKPETVKPDIFPVARKPIVGAYRFAKENLQNGAENNVARSLKYRLNKPTVSSKSTTSVANRENKFEKVLRKGENQNKMTIHDIHTETQKFLTRYGYPKRIEPDTHSIKIISGNCSNFTQQSSGFKRNLENLEGFSSKKFKPNEAEFMLDVDKNCFKSTQIQIKTELIESTFPDILSPVPIRDTGLKKTCDVSTQFSPTYSKSQKICQNSPVNISPINANVLTAHSVLILSPEEKDGSKRRNLMKRRLLFDEAFDENIPFDYTDEMLPYLLTINSKYVLQRNFCRAYNPCIESRSKILNWILKMQKQLYLSTELFCLVTRLFDNILAKITVPSNVYQLVGLTICWIVTKCYSFHNLSAKEILKLCANRYTPYRLVKMEKKILKAFKFSVVINVPQVFSNYYMNKLHFESEHRVRYYVSYILELFALSVHFSTFSSSELASGALYLALRLLYPSQTIYERISGILGYHPLEEIRDVSELMYMHLLKICDPACKVGKPFREYNSKEINNFNVLLQTITDCCKRPKFY